jgi:hypothetical protein
MEMGRTHLKELAIISKFNDSGANVITETELKAFNTMVDYAIELEIENLQTYMSQKETL